MPERLAEPRRSPAVDGRPGRRARAPGRGRARRRPGPTLSILRMHGSASVRRPRGGRRPVRLDRAGALLGVRAATMRGARGREGSRAPSPRELEDSLDLFESPGQTVSDTVSRSSSSSSSDGERRARAEEESPTARAARVSPALGESSPDGAARRFRARPRVGAPAASPLLSAPPERDPGLRRFGVALSLGIAPGRLRFHRGAPALNSRRRSDRDPGAVEVASGSRHLHVRRCTRPGRDRARLSPSLPRGTVSP